MKLTQLHIKFAVTLAKIVLMVAVVACIYLILNYSHKNKNEITHQSVVERVEAIGKLSLVKMTIQDVIEYTMPRTLLPDASALLIVQGEVEAGIDLSKIQKQNIEMQKDAVTLILPEPAIMNFKINHQKSRVYDTKNNWLSGAEIVDEAYAKAEIQIKNTALEQDILTVAKENAVKFFTSFFHLLGYPAVNIEFQQNGDNQSVH